jgi:hypothetical protein
VIGLEHFSRERLIEHAERLEAQAKTLDGLAAWNRSQAEGLRALADDVAESQAPGAVSVTVEAPEVTEARTAERALGTGAIPMGGQS